jgi:hypothetical protein
LELGKKIKSDEEFGYLKKKYISIENLVNYNYLDGNKDVNDILNLEEHHYTDIVNYESVTHNVELKEKEIEFKETLVKTILKLFDLYLPQIKEKKITVEDIISVSFYTIFKDENISDIFELFKIYPITKEIISELKSELKDYINLQPTNDLTKSTKPKRVKNKFALLKRRNKLNIPKMFTVDLDKDVVDFIKKVNEKYKNLLGNNVISKDNIISNLQNRFLTILKNEINS